jgi:type I restriction enzyme S subunit
MYGGFNQIGRTGYLKTAAATNQALSVLNPHPNTVLPMYLLIWLNAKVDLWRNIAGSSRKDPNITGSDVAAFPIAFPSLPEQRKIAAFFTAIDARIHDLKTQKHLLEQYKKGVMQQIFAQTLRFKADDGKDFPDWELKTLEEIAEKKSSAISANKIEDNFGDFDLYGASGILKKIDFYTEENDYVSIIKDGAGVGRVFYCHGKSSVLGTMEIIKPQKGLNTYFLFYLLSKIDFTKHIMGSTIPHIYFKDYKKELCEFPCIEEQAKIADFLSAIDVRITVTQKQIQQTEAWKKGLFQRMLV